LTVYDDSVEANAIQNAAILKAVERNEHCIIRHIDGNSRASYISALSRESGVDKDIIEFGLANRTVGPLTAGSSRNVAILDLAGHAFMFADDDVLMDICSVPSRRADIELVSRRYPVETFFHDDLTAAMSDRTLVVCDVLTLHNAYLGKRVQLQPRLLRHESASAESEAR
jgi:hypothetical protein